MVVEAFDRARDDCIQTPGHPERTSSIIGRRPEGIPGDEEIVACQDLCINHTPGLLGDGARWGGEWLGCERATAISHFVSQSWPA